MRSMPSIVAACEGKGIRRHDPVTTRFLRFVHRHVGAPQDAIHGVILFPLGNAEAARNGENPAVVIEAERADRALELAGALQGVRHLTVRDQTKFFSTQPASGAVGYFR